LLNKKKIAYRNQRSFKNIDGNSVELK
jgi:hypothetical protein